jgi:nucleotide-binding universal stress UspA family protein
MTRLFRRILVPHDFSDHATAALRVAADLASAHHGKLTVLHVLAPFYTGPGFPPAAEIASLSSAELVADLQTDLERRVATVLRGRTRGVTCRAVAGDPAAAIVKVARDHDSIVMATLGRTGMRRMLVGSVAEKVVRLSPVPVLTIHAGVARTRRSAQRGRTRRR